MNRIIKQIAVAALAVTTVGAGTTTQAHAGSDFKRLLLGAAAAGIIINELKKDDVRKHDVAPKHVERSHKRKRVVSKHRSNSRFHKRSKHRVSRHHSRSSFKHSRGFRRSYKH